MSIAKKTYRLRNTECSVRAEGSVTNLQFKFGSTCGEQEKPSISVRTAGSSSGVLTHAQVHELAVYFKYWAEVMDDPSILGEGHEWVGQTLDERTELGD